MKKSIKKLLALTLTGAFLVGALTGCGKSGEDDKTITVAASATPHAEILEYAKDKLKEQGYDLQVTVFDDYVKPNEVVESGDFDANYFQHVPYLESFNEEKGTHLAVAGKIHYEPFGIYPEQRRAWMRSQTAILSQYQTIQQTRQEHCFFCRIMASSH